MSKEKPAYEERYEEFKKQRDLQHDEQAKNIEAHAQQTGIDLLNQIEQDAKRGSGSARLNLNSEVAKDMGGAMERVEAKVQEWRDAREAQERER